MKLKKPITKNDIICALALKFVALAAIWFFFVHNHEIKPTADFVARHLFNQG